MFLVAGPCASELQPPSNVRLLGNLSDRNELARLYSIAEVTVLTSKRETFSMPLAESLCCGTPVVGFRAGGPESVALTEFCAFVDHGDVDALEQSVREKLDSPPMRTSIAEMASRSYSKEVMCGQYMRLYRELCER